MHIFIGAIFIKLTHSTNDGDDIEMTLPSSSSSSTSPERHYHDNLQGNLLKTHLMDVQNIDFYSSALHSPDSFS